MFSGLLDDAMSVISAPYSMAKAAKPYLRDGMDYLSDMLPERAQMKAYIPGEYDDYAIDAIGDGYNYLRGLLDDAPSGEMAMINMRDPMTGAMLQPEPEPTSFPGLAGRDPLTGATSSPIAALFQQAAPMPEANELMGAYAGTEYGYSPAASARPRLPSTQPMMMPERMKSRARSDRNIQATYPSAGSMPSPMGLLSGEMMPQGFQVEEAVAQPMLPKGFAKPIEELQNMSRYLDNSTRSRVKRDQDMDARMMAANARIRNALSR